MYAGCYGSGRYLRQNIAMIRRTAPKPVKRRRTFVREWRQYRDMTLERLADLIGLTYVSVSRIERGLQPYKQQTIEALAAALMTDVQSLLTRDPNHPEDIWPIWDRATRTERAEIVEHAKLILKRQQD
jgi:transcriptional regulator with XRE-family HTH domain